MPIKKIEKQLAKNNPLRSAKEKKQNRLIIIGFTITAALIVLLTGYALLYEFVIKDRIPVARVNGSKIDNTYFTERVKLERNAFIQQYQMMNAQYQYAANDEQTAQYYLNQLLQMQQILNDYEYFGESVLNSIIDDEVVAQQAKDLGITVSEQEIEDTIQQIFGYFPKGTPTMQPVPTLFPTPTLSLTQQAILNYTPTPSNEILELNEESVEEPANGQDSDEEASTPENNAETDESDLLIEEEGENVETEIDATPTATSTEVVPTVTPMPTSTPYTEQLFLDNYSQYITDMTSVGVSEESLRKYIYHYILTGRVKEEIVKDAPTTAEQVWARHILVETEEEAKDVLARLENGDEWSVIAEEVSIDTSNKSQGGDLGWFTKGKMVAEFDEAAFKLKIGEISDPVQTQFGWHIIQLVGKGEMPLTAWDYQDAQEKFYQDWFEKVKSETDIVINDVWKDIVPTEPSLTG